MRKRLYFSSRARYTCIVEGKDKLDINNQILKTIEELGDGWLYDGGVNLDEVTGDELTETGEI